MNDSQELVYARKVAARVAARLLEDRELRPQTAGETLLREVAQEKFHYWQWDRYFIACFTENADQLSQRRAYADDGLGYAVGFRGHAHWATGGPRPVQWERVIYDEDAQDALLEPILRHAASTPEGANHFLARLWSVLAIIKNPAFREEREWRLVVQDWPGAPSDFHYIPSRFGVAAKMKLGCVKSSYRIESAVHTSKSANSKRSQALGARRREREAQRTESKA